MSTYVTFSKSVNPYENVAYEKALFDTYQQEDMLVYLWVNQACVIAGCNQNVCKEFEMEYLEKHHILPVRRFSGGGAVYQDLGNLNYTFIGKNLDFDACIKIIQNALAVFGITAIKSGRNDLLVEGKKVSGTAWYMDEDCMMFHGTLLVDVNLDHLSHALTPSHYKLSKKGIDSVRTRVANCTQFANGLTIDKLQQAILSELSDVIVVDEWNSSNHQALTSFLQDPSWIYTINQEGDLVLHEVLDEEEIILHLSLNQGVIIDVVVESDGMDPCLAKRIKERFLMKNFYNMDVHAMLCQSK